jgi:hypothetical protein
MWIKFYQILTTDPPRVDNFGHFKSNQGEPIPIKELSTDHLPTSLLHIVIECSLGPPKDQKILPKYVPRYFLF